ncbi:MAG: cation transporter [Patescibacteria group bacterium]
MNELRFKLEGLHCQSCVKISQMNIGDISGVKNVEIDLTTGDGRLEAEREVRFDEVVEALKNTNYTVTKE